MVDISMDGRMDGLGIGYTAIYIIYSLIICKVDVSDNH